MLSRNVGNTDQFLRLALEWPDRTGFHRAENRVGLDRTDPDPDRPHEDLPGLLADGPQLMPQMIVPT